MPGILLLLLSLVLPVRPAAADAAVVAETAVAPRTLDLTIDSPAMGGRQKVRLLLPAGWSRTAGRTWPTLWLLHGGVDDYTAWTRETDVARLTADSDVIVVMPNGGSCGNYSDWWNYGDGGPPRWETFHMTELRRILERGYRAGTERVIAGNSMGGLGTMLYAARFPGAFRAAASFSGYLHTLYGHRPGDDSTGWGPSLSCPGTDWRRVWGDPDDQAAIWHAHNPYDLAGRLRGVRLWVAAGNGRAGPLGGLPFTDPVEAAAHDHAVAFTGRLDELGIPVTRRFYDGQHSWPYWQRELHIAYPFLMRALGQ
ncbi:alpha/beta hydrolase [Actinomadura macrotermitis]|uniref:Diacylglycerol acyltransferase/mycolyltransferase Ag85B n=1 Tax=Actinomadura macrotermitis TaxID=2585200 RepID=A0A7K0BZC1_9ACTN|nr:alpha/beta hydrolase family protein [Actinomadura macrotermitis]MQY06538.1 Diacylglycerol acyltransferase/mycolyltransferase Ag85B [Actinomadura macrotermitis]